MQTNHRFSRLILAAFAASLSTAPAAILTQWTFEVPTTPADLTNSASISGIVASTGAGTASGVHLSANTDWTTPAGNGSVDSLSSNEWALGDYYQFVLSTIGANGVSLAWDQTGSNTGPRDFKLAYSNDGTNFTDFGSPYTLINGAWTAGVPVVTTSYSFDLSGVTALDNQLAVYFRLIDNSTVSINPGTVAAAGTGRVDNFTVNAVVVPEPTAFTALLGGASLLGLIRRHRK